MFSTYEEFKDVLVDFHPEKIDYTFSEKHNGWLNDIDSPKYKITENDDTWMLWLVKEKPERHAMSKNPNEPLQIRELLLKLNIISVEDYRQEMIDDPDIDYPKI